MPKNLTNIKEDILTVTRQLLKESGYADLNIRNIASTCGIATGTLYNYYGSKNEIVAEILYNDWNLMLRRIDQASKTSASIVDTIEIMFNELMYFMKNVHGSWFDNYPTSTKNMKIYKIHDKKKFLRKQLSDKISSFLGATACSTSDSKTSTNLDSIGVVSDLISRILLSYACEDDVDFTKLKPSLQALINQLEDK